MNSAERITDFWIKGSKTLPNLPDSGKELQLLLGFYADKGRAYHNADHISAFLNWITTLQNHFDQTQPAIWAAIFHDVIYLPGRKDNESRSAQEAIRVLSNSGISQNELNWIEDAILRTANHDGKGANSDTLLFLDIDLSILGAAPVVYENYTRQIRREYSKIPWFLYKSGRKQVLQHFLERETIYFSPYFQENFEFQAKENVRKEIQLLGG